MSDPPTVSRRARLSQVERAAYALRVSNIELPMDFQAELPEVSADPHQLQQVFLAPALEGIWGHVKKEPRLRDAMDMHSWRIGLAARAIRLRSEPPLMQRQLEPEGMP